MVPVLRTSALTLSLLALLPAAQAAAWPAGSTTLLSRPSGLATLPGGLVNDSAAGRFGLSADGCRAVFTSSSDGLSAADDDDLENAYVRDRCTGTTTLVSRASGAAGAAADAHSYAPAISRDGKVV